MVMTLRRFLMIHGNIIGALSGAEGYFLSHGTLYIIIPLGIILGVYGNFFGTALSKRVKVMFEAYISEKAGSIFGSNIKAKIDTEIEQHKKV